MIKTTHAASAFGHNMAMDDQTKLERNAAVTRAYMKAAEDQVNLEPHTTLRTYILIPALTTLIYIPLKVRMATTGASLDSLKAKVKSEIEAAKEVVAKEGIKGKGMVDIESDAEDPEEVFKKIMADIRQKATEEARRKHAGGVDLRSVFLEFDEDHSGAIDRDEFRGMLRKLGVVLNEDTLDTVFRYFDKDGAGTINVPP